MEIYFYPPWSRHVKEYIYLGGELKSISWLVRDSFTPALKEKIMARDDHRCVYCLSEDRLAVHHVKPVWACVIDAILPFAEQQGTCWHTINGNKVGSFDWSQFNRPNNLETVCRTCHGRETKKVNALWKKRLGEKNVVFGGGHKRKRQQIVNRLIEAQRERPKDG